MALLRLGLRHDGRCSCAASTNPSVVAVRGWGWGLPTDVVVSRQTETVSEGRRIRDTEGGALYLFNVTSPKKGERALILR